MRRLVLLLIPVLALASPTYAAERLIVKKSPHAVAATIDRLNAVLTSKDITVFARIDHAAGAQRAGLSLRPTQLLIFGNPKLGTPLMSSNQRIGLDLPLKALAWQDETGNVWLGYTKPEELKDRYDIADQDEVFKAMAQALDNLTDAALKPAQPQ